MADENAVEESVEETEVVETQAEEVVETTEETTEEVTEESEESTEESEEESEESDKEPEEHEDGLTVKGLNFNDMEVEGTIPEEVDSMLKEKGFDARELTEALYADGEVSLPEETLEQLYEAYGKFQVDSYIAGLKTHAELLKYTSKEETAAQEAAIQERWDGALTVVGSEEGWDSLASWVEGAESSELVSDEDVANFNEVMATGSAYTQKLAIEAMNNKMLSTIPEGQKPELQLLDGDSGSTNSAKSMLTGAEYIDLVSSGKYDKADSAQRSAWDSARRKGMNKGL